MVSETRHTGYPNNDNAHDHIQVNTRETVQLNKGPKSIMHYHVDTKEVYTKLVVPCVHPEVAMSACVGITT